MPDPSTHEHVASPDVHTSDCITDHEAPPPSNAHADRRADVHVAAGSVTYPGSQPDPNISTDAAGSDAHPHKYQRSPDKYFDPDTYGYAVWLTDDWGTRGFQPYTGALCYCPADNSATGGHVHVIAYPRH